MERMEEISYQSQIIWGTSLGMEKDDELKKCYEYVKEYVATNKDVYKICEQSQNTINFIDVRWMCDELVNSTDKCNKVPSISLEALAMVIECMVPETLHVDGKNVIEQFKKHGYIETCKVGRAFFTK